MKLRKVMLPFPASFLDLGVFLENAVIEKEIRFEKAVRANLKSGR